VTISNIALIAFAIALLVNAYFKLDIVLNDLGETQRLYKELMNRPPRPEPSVPFRKA
jgi:hypothetical protein